MAAPRWASFERSCDQYGRKFASPSTTAPTKRGIRGWDVGARARGRSTVATLHVSFMSSLRWCNASPRRRTGHLDQVQVRGTPSPGVYELLAGYNPSGATSQASTDPLNFRESESERNSMDFVSAGLQAPFRCNPARCTVCDFEKL